MAETPLLECVPNFSEGRDPAVIGRLADAIASVEEVSLLDVDPGRGTNRTVITFVGPPDAVVEAAVRAGRAAAEAIDMSRHHGEHPRFGAMDVCPLVPVAGITMEETVAQAHRLARRLADEVGLTVYCYGHAARHPDRRDLAAVRAGEYEGLEARLADPVWAPDFGPAAFNPHSGATAVGARDFLVAYNVNLNTTSSRRANSVAFDVRERGRVLRHGNPLTGEVIRDPDGNPLWEPGTLPAVKAIGWYLEEFGIAQVSMNLTDISVTPIHLAFEEVCEKAAARGMRVTGSEIVGLVPLRAMLDAGRYFLAKQKRSLGVPDEEVVRLAVRSLGLDELRPFDPRQKIIEWRLKGAGKPGLVDATVAGFTHRVAADSPAPGGGSVAALAGALGAALGTMVANLSAHKRGWDHRWEEFSAWAVRGKDCHEALLRLVDEDTRAFDALLAAFRLPQDHEGRAEAIAAATRHAIEVPLAVMEASLEALAVAEGMAAEGLKSSVSDTGVGALLAAAAVRSAYLNVRINAATLADDARRSYLERGAVLEARARAMEADVLAQVEERLGEGER
ncbi:MAG: glutamate formimidoyltransferase [Acidimicrobiia bacterium]|nr:glutamate formimidoyltransferase [Acidimicrobiia bacterium]